MYPYVYIMHTRKPEEGVGVFLNHFLSYLSYFLRQSLFLNLSKSFLPDLLVKEP